MPRPRFFKTPIAFRAWLEQHHANRAELFVGFYKKGSGRGGMTYSEAVEVALCFGWIDGVLGPIDHEKYMHRFTPRKQRSYWSAVNLKRAEALQARGEMHPAGLAALARRPEDSGRRYAFEAEAMTLSAAFTRRFKAEQKAWAFFQRQAPSYRKRMTHHVMSAKQAETRERRLVRLIAASAAGQQL